MPWVIKRTDTFLKHLKELKNHHELIHALDAKIQRLNVDPEAVGGMLSGTLHGKRSTRLVASYRLIFQVDQPNSIVYLVAVDHRSVVYK
ncbi:MAG TPA: type II toxin-antitoxin system RelE/ParE family toxin [Candidatus Nanoarchaeia archaeon]|nr:type II toxin-antitoxin system RelE/ParE family toxin [Candidatus Nanoarchaeia archaeon]